MTRALRRSSVVGAGGVEERLGIGGSVPIPADAASAHPADVTLDYGNVTIIDEATGHTPSPTFARLLGQRLLCRGQLRGWVCPFISEEYPGPDLTIGSGRVQRSLKCRRCRRAEARGSGIGPGQDQGEYDY